MRNTQSTQFLTEDIQNLRIAVIGDVMLDRYVYGEVKRISPEAPVPVNRVRRMESVLGGAGNVAANLAGLGVKVYAAGVTGLDEHRESLEKKMAAAGIDYSGLLPMPGRSTITKMRIIGARQQMLRLDFEEPGDLARKRNGSCWTGCRNGSRKAWTALSSVTMPKGSARTISARR